jgi:hypothetical protein
MNINFNDIVKCYVCEKSLIDERVINNKVEKILKGDYDEIILLLNDGCKTRVPICSFCKEKVDIAKDKNKIIANFKDGLKKTIKLKYKNDEEKLNNIDKKYKKIDIIYILKEKLFFKINKLNKKVGGK